MDILIYIPFGLLPSFIWLFYYLRKDSHPEPKVIISEIFFLGMLSTFLAFVLQYLFLTAFTINNVLTTTSFAVWLVLAFTEEFSKFAFARARLFREKEFDELPDAMIYMIAAGLGFAALENIFYLTQLFPFNLDATLELVWLRFLGSTLVHALASGVFGYFWALSFREVGLRKGTLLFAGLSLATLLHALFNYSIILREPLATAALLVIFSLLVSAGFKKLKALK